MLEERVFGGAWDTHWGNSGTSRLSTRDPIAKDTFSSVNWSKQCHVSFDLKPSGWRFCWGTINSDLVNKSIIPLSHSYLNWPAVWRVFRVLVTVTLRSSRKGRGKKANKKNSRCKILEWLYDNSESSHTLLCRLLWLALSVICNL